MVNLKIYHAIFCCERDEALIEGHIRDIEALGVPMQRCVYFGMGNREPRCPSVAYHVVGALDIYENLPVKTFCLMEHALAAGDWDVLLKTDVNVKGVAIEWPELNRHELVGYVSDIPGSRTSHRYVVTQSALQGPYGAPMPERWVGGPAYCVSRPLVRLIVAEGPWKARSYAYEDQMVSLIAEQNSIVAQQGITWTTD